MGWIKRGLSKVHTIFLKFIPCMTINPGDLLCRHPQKCTERLREPDQESVILIQEEWSGSRKHEPDPGREIRIFWRFLDLYRTSYSYFFFELFVGVLNWRIWKRSRGGYYFVILRPPESYLVWLYRNRRGCVMRNSHFEIAFLAGGPSVSRNNAPRDS